MSEAVASRTSWALPTLTTGADGVVRIDFRDCIVEVEHGIVRSYVDKLHNVRLIASGDMDCWTVFSGDGEDTGQTWRGIIAFDGTQLLIQQARNSLFRLYRTDGTIETQLRMCRVIEQPGLRTTMFPQAQSFEEDVQTGTRTVFWGDHTVVRQVNGKAAVFDQAGKFMSKDADDDAEADDANDDRLDGHYSESELRVNVGDAMMTNPVLASFADLLSHWETFCLTDADAEYYYGGPPGLCEAAPGKAFTHPCPGKPDNLREPDSHDFEDGTILNEYIGRINGVPYLAHELVTYEGFVLARTAEYDQPRSITFCDARGVLRTLENVLSVELQFDPASNGYVTCVTDSAGAQVVYPKGARFERLDGPS